MAYIKNGIVTISVIIPYNDYKHEFKVDIPVLNGLIQSPQYMTRGRTIVPFTEEGIYSEITKESFVKLSPYYKKKDNLFSIKSIGAPFMGGFGIYVLFLIYSIA